MRFLALFGTGWTRLLNIALALFLLGTVVWGAWHMFTGHYKDIGRNEVKQEVLEKNQKLDTKVDQVNTKVVHDVTDRTKIIEKNSKDIEYVIRNSPTEQMSNVTKSRIDGVYRQQQSVREASQGSKRSSAGVSGGSPDSKTR